MTIKVTKRDNTQEDLDLEKMHKVVFFACEDIAGVSASEVEIKSQISFFDGIRSVSYTHLTLPTTVFV